MPKAGRRYGADQLPPDLETRLGAFSTEQLAELTDTIAISPTLADWLATFPA